MAKTGKGSELKALAAAGAWVWANRDRIAAALQSAPVQEALKSPQARRVLESPSVRRVIEHPQVRAAAASPELQQWLRANFGATPPPAAPAQGAQEPYTGETRRLG
jgi:hypothetical protein